MSIVMLIALIPAGAAIATDIDDVNATLAAIDLGVTGPVTTNLTLPTTGLPGVSITWSSNAIRVIWENGTVIRPTNGIDATVTLTATATKGIDSNTRDFTIVVPSYTATMRMIKTVHEKPGAPGIPVDSSSGVMTIEVPVGSSPKLPFRVWVEYNDGYGEWRNTKWPWGNDTFTHAGGPRFGPPAVQGVWEPIPGIEGIWRSKPLGEEYTVTGWITGVGNNDLGQPFVVDCIVIPVAEWEAKYVPNYSPLADPLPPGSVVLTGENRMTANARRSIARTLSYSIDTYLWNYRHHFGFQTPGAVDSLVDATTPLERLTGNPRGTTPTGWEGPGTMLRGHGTGHFLSSLATAYNSGLATPVQQGQLRDRMIAMVNEMRKLQELTFVSVDGIPGHPNRTDNGGTGFRESSNTWPYNVADLADNAPDWGDSPMPTLEGMMAMSPPPNQYVGTGANAPQVYGHRVPEWYGYGYLNAIPPLHAVFNESYGAYRAPMRLWAPYYGWHKQLAGLLEIYYIFNDSEDPEEKAAAYKALQICVDMSRWISERLTVKTALREDLGRPVRGPAYIPPGATAPAAYYGTNFGHMAYTWSTDIAGEYGGVNESIARCAQALEAEIKAGNPLFAEYAGEFKSYPKSAANPGEEAKNKVKHSGGAVFTHVDLLISGAGMFYNPTYWNPLIVNSEIMSLDGNAHANSRLPNFSGTLWSFRGNHDPDFHKIAKNNFDFNISRYRYYNGGVGTHERYNTPYTMMAQIPTNGQGAETCCAYNLARLAKDLACFDPDNPEFADFYERFQYNQLIGSLDQTGWRNTYLFFLGQGANADFRGQTAGDNCCGGTSAETHNRYTDATYLVNNRLDAAKGVVRPTIWVNAYMPTVVTWAAAGVELTQACKWPSEESTFTVTALTGMTPAAFDMRLRVPWWATKGFVIERNGTPIVDEYLPSSFVTVANVTPGDVIVVKMPFIPSIDYGPDRVSNTAGVRSWAGTVFYGPLTMAGVTTAAASQTAWTTLNLDSDLANITGHGPRDDVADGSAATNSGANKNLYHMTIPGNQFTDTVADDNTAGTRELRPSYYRTTVSNQPRPVHYFRINLMPRGLDRTILQDLLNEVRQYDSADFSGPTFTALQTAIGVAVGVYQNEAAIQSDINAEVTNLDSAVAGLIPLQTSGSKTDLLGLINEAKGLVARQTAWQATYGVLFDAAWAEFLADPGNDDKYNAAMQFITDPKGDGSLEGARPAPPFAFERVVAMIPLAEAVYNDTSATLHGVQASLDALLDVYATQMRPGHQPEPEDLPPVIAKLAEARAKRVNDFRPDSFVPLREAIAVAEELIAATQGGSSTIEGNAPHAIWLLQTAIDGLIDDVIANSVNRWGVGGAATTNTATYYSLYAGNTNIGWFTNNGAHGPGERLIQWPWEINSWWSAWRFIPDDNHEYFRISRVWQALNATNPNANAGGTGNHTSVAPLDGALAAGTPIELTRASSGRWTQDGNHNGTYNGTDLWEDDFTWWKFNLQPDGTYIITNKQDPTLSIATDGSPTASEGLVLAPLDDPNNKWRIGRFNNAATTFWSEPIVPLTKKVTGIWQLEDISVAHGTVINSANLSTVLPETLRVLFEGPTRAMREVTWDYANFNTETRQLTGTIDNALEGIEINPDQVKTTVTIIELEPVPCECDDVDTVTVPATCLVAGSITVTCKDCEEVVSITPIAALGHSYVAVVTPPTCTASGFTTHTCSRCNDSYTDSNVPALGHVYVPANIAATCVAAGRIALQCTRCNDLIVTETLPALGHSPGAAATCTTAQRCTVCNAVLAAALGHKPIVGEERLPTATEPGLRVMICEVCGIELSRVVLPATCQPGGNASVSNARFLGVSNMNRVTTVTFTATVVLPGGSSQVRIYSFDVPANNNNIDGRYVFPAGHELAGAVLTYDIKGNGSNIKAFSFGNGAVSPGHRPVVGEETLPTATVDGLRVMVCANCGIELERIVLPATGTGQQPGVVGSVSNVRFLGVSNMSRVTTVTFTATVTPANGSSVVRTYSFEVGANNNNVDGTYVFPAGHDLAGRTLTYDIKGNGSNVKAFSIR